MRVLLAQLDGKWPSVALMRLSAHHKERGDTVSFAFVPGVAGLDRELFGVKPDRVYGSLIFEKTKPLAERLLRIYPDATLGGSGWDFEDGKPIRHTTLEGIGVTTLRQDYSLYPAFKGSLGFSQRGCRLKCPFCIVPHAEPGPVREVQGVPGLYRGEPHPRDVVLLDNDFFGQRRWRQRVRELEGFRVAFTQGVNVRTLTARQARALAKLDYRTDTFKDRRLYCAWDNAADGERVFKGLRLLERAGVKPDAIMVYMIVGYWHGPRLVPEDFERVARLREFGARPFPMPFKKTPEVSGFVRWVVGSHDKRVSWAEWEAARYQPRNVHKRREADAMPLFAGVP